MKRLLLACVVLAAGLIPATSEAHCGRVGKVLKAEARAVRFAVKKVRERERFRPFARLLGRG